MKKKVSRGTGYSNWYLTEKQQKHRKKHKPKWKSERNRLKHSYITTLRQRMWFSRHLPGLPLPMPRQGLQPAAIRLVLLTLLHILLCKPEYGVFNIAHCVFPALQLTFSSLCCMSRVLRCLAEENLSFCCSPWWSSAIVSRKQYIIGHPHCTLDFIHTAEWINHNFTFNLLSHPMCLLLLTQTFFFFFFFVLAHTELNRSVVVWFEP